MNIQMILSALPASHTGTSQPGAEPGHFALALGQAAQGKAPGHSHDHTAAFGTALPEVLPTDLAGREVLLQALHAAGYALNGDSETGESDVQLDEIMQRLELIAANHEQGLSGDEVAPVAPLPETVDIAPAINDSTAAPEPEVMPQVLATTIASVEPRQQTATPQGEPVGSLRQNTPLQTTPPQTSPLQTTPLQTTPPQTSPLQTTPLQTTPPQTTPLQTTPPQTTPLQTAPQQAATTAELLANTVQAGTEARSTDNAAVTALARTGAAQVTASEFASWSAEAPRGGGFVPEAMTPAAIGTNSGQSASTAQPALPAQTTLSAPVQSQAWSNQLGQQLVQFARQGGEQRIEMRLNPAELGPLSVTLKMTEQGAQAQFLSAHAPVRQVLEQAIPQLREALAEQGISLGEASVGEQRQQDAQAFAGGHSGQGQRGAASDADLDLADSDTLTPATGATVALDGRVDLYA